MAARSELTTDGEGSETPRRQRLEPEERRALLLDLGLEMFGERSYEDVEVAEICGRADISRALFYHYFGSKKAFYLATVERAVEAVHERTRADDPGRPLDSMRKNISAYFDYARTHPHGALVAVWGRVGSGMEIEEHFQPFRERTHCALTSVIGQENVDAYVDLAVWTWQDIVESMAIRLIEQRDVPTDAAATFVVLAFCNLLDEAFAASGRPLPAIWKSARDEMRAKRSAAS